MVQWCGHRIQGAQMRSGRILVVDDQVELAENIAEILQGIRFDTEVAGSAEAALERIGRGGITAVVTDFRLPGRTGAQLIEELRRRGERMPVLMMSAYTDDITIDQSRTAGAWMFLPKPVPLTAFVTAFESLAKQPIAALLVDDEEDLTDNLAEALALAGHEAVVTHSVSEALAQQRRVQTAVLDYRLPDGTGVELARQLRARDPTIRILFVSGYASDLKAHLPGDLFGVETLEKPFDTGRVVTWVQIAAKRAS